MLFLSSVYSVLFNLTQFKIIQNPFFHDKPYLRQPTNRQKTKEPAFPPPPPQLLPLLLRFLPFPVFCQLNSTTLKSGQIKVKAKAKAKAKPKPKPKPKPKQGSLLYSYPHQIPNLISSLHESKWIGSNWIESSRSPKIRWDGDVDVDKDIEKDIDVIQI